MLAAELSLLAALAAMLFVPDWPKGMVDVATVPSGAQLNLLDAPGATSPARLPMPAGGLHITAEAPGYLPLDTLIPPRTGSVTLYLRYAFPVTVTSVPSGAVVLFDGVERGRTPATFEAGNPGRHVVTAVSDDSVAVSRTVVLAVNRPVSIHLPFPVESSGGMLFIPGGEYRFQGGPGATLPSRTVRVEPFYLGATEVTNARYCAYLNSVDPGARPDSVLGNGRTPLLADLFRCDWPLDIRAVESGGYAVLEGLELHPVRSLSFRACSLYCDWLTSVDDRGITYRLPTEIEWEYAATAGDGREWPWGADPPSGLLLNCSDSCETIARREPDLADGHSQTAPAGSYRPGPWGLYDMAGNVWEWCSDWQGGEGFARFGVEDTIRCLRGGSWLSSAGDCRCATRLGLDAGMGYPFAGFRIAGSVPRSE